MSETEELEPVDKLSYESALGELEQIIANLESADTSVDKLTSEVSRGTELIQHCKKKLESVTTDVNKVVESMDKGE